MARVSVLPKATGEPLGAPWRPPFAANKVFAASPAPRYPSAPGCPAVSAAFTRHPQVTLGRRPPGLPTPGLAFVSCRPEPHLRSSLVSPNSRLRKTSVLAFAFPPPTTNRPRPRLNAERLPGVARDQCRGYVIMPLELSLVPRKLGKHLPPSSHCVFTSFPVSLGPGTSLKKETRGIWDLDRTWVSGSFTSRLCTPIV